MAEVGDVVGGYRLIRRLGSGGMGTVFEACLEGDSTSVALKLLHPGIAADPDARARLEREVANLERLSGRNVARVVDAHITADLAFIVTTLVDGLSLEDSVAQDGPFAPEDLGPLAEGLYAAVEQVHKARLLHRDIKPGNVMVTYDDGPMLIDFGIAQLAEDERLTRTGFVTGTPGYLDPAALNGAAIGREGDWYGVAAVLLFAATGRPPFGRGRMEAVLARMAQSMPDVDGLPAGLAQTFAAALAADPADRPRHRVLLEAIRRFAKNQPVIPPAPGSSTRPAPATARTGPGTSPPYVPPTAPAHSTPVSPAPASAASVSPAPATPPPSYPPAQLAPPIARPAEAGYPAIAAPSAVSGVPGVSTAEPGWAADPRSRPGLVGLSGVVVSAAAIRFPGLAVTAVVLGFVLLTLVGMLHRRTRRRRLEAGQRRSDPWVTAGWALPLLIPAALTALLPLLIGAIVAASTWTIGTTLVLQDVVGAVPDAFVPAVAPVALAAGLTIAWWVPVSNTARTGARVVWSRLAPTAVATRVWVALGATCAVVLVIAGLAGGVVWMPVPEPPSLG